MLTQREFELLGLTVRSGDIALKVCLKFAAKYLTAVLIMVLGVLYGIWLFASSEKAVAWYKREWTLARSQFEATRVNLMAHIYAFVGGI
jgi:hypothetical protein